MKTNHIITLFLLLSFFNIQAQEKPSIPESDRIRLAEAFNLAEAIGNDLWKDWDKAPFALLLVTPDYEFLIRHPAPSPDFAPLGYDSLLRSNVYFRKQSQRLDLLANFPAIKGSNVSTIVVGQAENTSARTSTPWVVTLLHEHFHQLQNSQASYYADVNALNLSRGDRTGMWMLNYTFPYEQKEVQEQYARMSKLLVKALKAKSNSGRDKKLIEYLEARQKFQQMLNADDYRYFSFQLWQEGIARYTEYRIARLAAKKHKPAKAFRALEDFTSYKRVADSLHKGIFEQLAHQRLEEAKRIAFYPFGAAEGLLLDKLNPSWKSRYFIEKFELRLYYPVTE